MHILEDKYSKGNVCVIQFVGFFFIFCEKTNLFRILVNFQFSVEFDHFFRRVRFVHANVRHHGQFKSVECWFYTASHSIHVYFKRFQLCGIYLIIKPVKLYYLIIYVVRMYYYCVINCTRMLSIYLWNRVIVLFVESDLFKLERFYCIVQHIHFKL